MKILHKIALTMSMLIALGHAFVPHSHDDVLEVALHNHDEQHGFLDFVACFFSIDHESEDLENYLYQLSSALPSGNYAVIPATFAERPSPYYTELHHERTPHEVPALRGPPQQ